MMMESASQPEADPGTEKPKAVPIIPYAEAVTLATSRKTINYVRAIIGRRVPARIREEATGEAISRIWEIVISWNPEKCPSFDNYLAFCLRRVAIDLYRSCVHDKRTPHAKKPIPVSSLMDDDAKVFDFMGHVASEDEPIGWEIESADMVRHYTEELPEFLRNTIRARYLECNAATPLEASRNRGIRAKSFNSYCYEGTRRLRLAYGPEGLVSKPIGPQPE